MMGFLVKSSAEVECPVFDGSHTDEPSITLGKAETEGVRASIGLLLPNSVSSLSRAEVVGLGVQDGDEGG